MSTILPGKVIQFLVKNKMRKMIGLSLNCNQLLPVLLRCILYALESLKTCPEIRVKRYNRPNCMIKSFVALSSFAHSGVSLLFSDTLYSDTKEQST